MQQRPHKQLATIMALGGLAMAGNIDPAEAAELLSFGNRAGMAVTVVEKTSLDSTNAKARVAFTRENAKAYCVDFLKIEAERCVDVSMGRLKFPQAVTADCDALTFVDLEGTQLAFDLERSPRKGRDYRIVDRRTNRQIHTDSDYAAALDAFQLLCPERYAELQESPGCEIDGYEHLSTCPAEALAPKPSLGELFEQAVSMRCLVTIQHTGGMMPNPLAGSSSSRTEFWDILFNGTTLSVNGRAVAFERDVGNPAIISLRVVDAIAPDVDRPEYANIDPSERQLLREFRKALEFMMASRGKDRKLALRLDTAQAFFFDPTGSGPQNVMQGDCM